MRSGVANAKAKGKQIGRPRMTRDALPDAFYKHYALFSKGQVTKAEFARLLNVSRPTLDHWLAIMETEATA